MPMNNKATKSAPQRRFLMMVVVFCFFMVLFSFTYKVESSDHLSLITSHSSSMAASDECAESGAAWV
jgi:hypothetical protein